MHYSDISSVPLVRAATIVADYFDTHPIMGRHIANACRNAHSSGAQGQAYEVPALTTRDVAELVQDAIESIEDMAERNSGLACMILLQIRDLIELHTRP